jgi:hypothetical protein
MMGKPTIISSHPDPFGRTVTAHNEDMRRARYGRIQPMNTGGALRGVLSRFNPLG